MIILGCVLFFGAIGVWRSGLIGQSTALSSRLLPTSSSGEDARAIADRLRDTPECAKYRAAILAQRGQQGERARYLIEQAYREGKAENCLKLDIE